MLTSVKTVLADQMQNALTQTEPSPAFVRRDSRDLPCRNVWTSTSADSRTLAELTPSVLTYLEVTSVFVLTVLTDKAILSAKVSEMFF